MLERVKNSIKKTWGKASGMLVVLIALIIALTTGFYFLNEWLTVKSAENRWVELKEPYVLIQKNYEIYEVGQPGGPYQYFIFDNAHNVLRSSYSNVNPPEITITHGLIKVCEGIGTKHALYQYYEPEKGFDSSFYAVNIINESDTMVVYIDRRDKRLVVVQDIFDESKYYRTFERNFSDVEDPVTRADFINGGKQLRITYKVGKDEHEVTETIDLFDARDEL